MSYPKALAYWLSIYWIPAFSFTYLLGTPGMLIAFIWGFALCVI